MKKNNTKIFVSGYFNVLHPGHISLLKFAKRLGSELVVGLISKKIANVDHLHSDSSRIETLKSINFINKVVIIDQTIEKTLINEMPNIIVKGKEHENKINIEESVLQEIDAKIIFNSGEPNSDYDILYNNKDTSNIKMQKKFLKDHNIKTKTLLSYVKKFAKLKSFI